MPLFLLPSKNNLILQKYTCSVVQLCLTLQPHGLQHSRLPCPSRSELAQAHVH